MNVYLVFSAFTSIPTSLPASNRAALLHTFTHCSEYLENRRKFRNDVDNTKCESITSSQDCKIYYMTSIIDIYVDVKTVFINAFL
jgi:hypothetical protein